MPFKPHPSAVSRRRKPGYRRAFWQLSVGLLCLLVAGEAFPRDERQVAYAVKAALIFKLAKFIDWPKNVVQSETLHFCLVGPDRFGTSLKTLVRKPVKGMQVINLGGRGEETGLDGCQIVFFSDDNPEKQQTLLLQYGRHPMMTISDQPGFLQRGGMLYLGRKGKKMAITINRSAVQRSGLQVSALLFQLSLVVTDDLPGRDR
ncbi:MAG: YfiR family protein [Magnetococcales bacterium]|nr:YfiR family protein [Magnetococcales bacterium]